MGENRISMQRKIAALENQAGQEVLTATAPDADPTHGTVAIVEAATGKRVKPNAHASAGEE